MGLRADNGVNEHGSHVSVTADYVQIARFGEFFPRVFAYAHSLTGDEAAAREVAAEAFSSTFDHPKALNDDDFVLLLFSTAGEICRAQMANEGASGSLSPRERELLALVFDARLSREKVRRLMRTTEEALSSTLMRALRKIQESMKPAAARKFLRSA